MNYTIYFEFYGRKMKTDVEAGSSNEAKEIIRNKIIFKKTVLHDDDNAFQDLMNAMGLK